MNAAMQQRIFGARSAEMPIVHKVDDEKSKRYETLTYDKNGRLVRVK